jgi:hypothetical protein
VEKMSTSESLSAKHLELAAPDFFHGK